VEKRINDTDRYPLWEYTGSGIVECPAKKTRPGWQWHHYIPKRVVRKYVHLDRIQRLIYLPSEMHYNLHSGMTDERFYSLYKTARMDLLYNPKRDGRGIKE
jgi:hypothetical protein